VGKDKAVSNQIVGGDIPGLPDWEARLDVGRAEKKKKGGVASR